MDGWGREAQRVDEVGLPALGTDLVLIEVAVATVIYGEVMKRPALGHPSVARARAMGLQVSGTRTAEDGDDGGGLMSGPPAAWPRICAARAGFRHGGELETWP
jgi:hypothetical protein